MYKANYIFIGIWEPKFITVKEKKKLWEKNFKRVSCEKSSTRSYIVSLCKCHIRGLAVQPFVLLLHYIMMIIVNTWQGNRAVLPASSLRTCELELIVGLVPRLFDELRSDPAKEESLVSSGHLLVGTSSCISATAI